MKNQEPELKAALLKFEKLLREYPDQANEVMPFKYFLRHFIKIRTNSIELPTSEVMAVFKHEKPNTYYSLKKHTSNDLTFSFLTNIDMDYESAHKQLTKIKEVIM